MGLNPMNIGADIRAFLHRETGIGTYFYHLLTAMLHQSSPPLHFHLFSSSLKLRMKKALPHPSRFTLHDRRLPSKCIDFLWFRLRALSMERLVRSDLDLVHSPLPSIIPGPHKNVITLHDLCMLDHPRQVEARTRRHFASGMRRSLEDADGIISVSTFTRDRMIDHFGAAMAEKTVIIPHGSGLEGISEPSSPPLSLPPEFFLFVGTREPRKNLPSLIKALAILKSRGTVLNLVVAGKPGWEEETVEETIQKHRLEDHCFFLDYVDRSRLLWLYRRARALVFPSFYEGFGIPVLEAISLGCPVLCSDIPPLREFFRDIPRYFDPHSPESMAHMIAAHLKRPPSAEKLRREAETIRTKYNWETAACKTLDFYRRILE